MAIESPMALSDLQIERYARQIIVPGVGGIAQERLLSARMMLAGNSVDVGAVLFYLVGAGIGEIQLQLQVSDAAEQDRLILQAGQLNPEVRVGPASENPAGLNLILGFGGESETSAILTSRQVIDAAVPIIFVRMHEPVMIALLPQSPPCLRCADAELLTPSKLRSDNAGFVAMIATTEAFKFLISTSGSSGPTLFEFNGFACTTRPLRQANSCSYCASL